MENVAHTNDQVTTSGDPSSEQRLKAEAAVDRAITKSFRESLIRIKDGVGDLARELNLGSPMGEPGASGLVAILAGLRELEFLDEDIESVELAFEQRRIDTRPEREATNERAAATVFGDELERRGLMIVAKAPAATAPRTSRRVRRAS